MKAKFVKSCPYSRKTYRVGDIIEFFDKSKLIPGSTKWTFQEELDSKALVLIEEQLELYPIY